MRPAANEAGCGDWWPLVMGDWWDAMLFVKGWGDCAKVSSFSDLKKNFD